MDKVKITIIGAGVVGLAIAAELSQKFKDIVLLEKEASFGQGTSSRNSEVIHAGIYYPEGSLKAKLCVEGNRLLYAFCRENNVPHAKIGKLIVAMHEDETKGLHELEEKAKANGVEDLVFLNAGEVKEKEPVINACAALYSPGTGIIDSHALMKVLEKKSGANGVMLSYASELTRIKKSPNGYVLEINHDYSFGSEIVINSSGLFSDQIAGMLGIDIVKNNYKLHYCKGEYFSYSKPAFLKHLVYPVPEQDIKGLGIHSVIDLGGRLKFGPNTEYIDKIDYTVNPNHRNSFFQAIKDLFPFIQEEDLAPDQAGVRPKLQGQGDGFRDFLIKEEGENEFSQFINLIGIESPGLTACLAIGKRVLSLVDTF